MTVSRKTIQVVVLAFLLTAVMFYPAIETFDHWDPPNPASDTELALIDLLTITGVFVLLVQAVIDADLVHGCKVMLDLLPMRLAKCEDIPKQT